MSTVIFLGPTISIVEAQSILPNAWYHPPVQCGDILKVLRLQPQVIAIIDGHFSSIASVWHKEILLAIQSGVLVFGSSSMGALRAAELNTVGMIGIGDIYQRYLSGEYTDDDDVAIAHADANHNYFSANTPIVNVKATLDLALANHIIDTDTSTKILSSLKSSPYFSRDLFSLCKTMQLTHFHAWVKNNYLDQKKSDAITLLKRLKISPPVAPQPKSIPIPKSVFIMKLYREIASTSFNSPLQWLPKEERDLAQQVDSLPFRYLAKLLHLYYDINPHCKQDLETTAPEEFFKSIDIPTADQLPSLDSAYQTILNALSRHPPDQLNERCLNYSIQLLQYLNCWLATNNYVFSKEQLKVSLDYFRQKCALVTGLAMNAWMERNTISSDQEQVTFIRLLTVIHLFLEENSWGLFNIETIINHDNWLQQAYQLCAAQYPG